MFSTTVPNPSDSAVVRSTAARRWSSSSSVRTSLVTSSRPRSRVNAEMCWGCTGSGVARGQARTLTVTRPARGIQPGTGDTAQVAIGRGALLLCGEVRELSGALCGVHRLIRRPEQRLRVVAVARVHGDSEAGPQILEACVRALDQPA